MSPCPTVLFEIGPNLMQVILATLALLGFGYGGYHLGRREIGLNGMRNTPNL